MATPVLKRKGFSSEQIEIEKDDLAIIYHFYFTGFGDFFDA